MQCVHTKQFTFGPLTSHQYRRRVLFDRSELDRSDPTEDDSSESEDVIDSWYWKYLVRWSGEYLNAPLSRLGFVRSKTASSCDSGFGLVKKKINTLVPTRADTWAPRSMMKFRVRSCCIEVNWRQQWWRELLLVLVGNSSFRETCCDYFV